MVAAASAPGYERIIRRRSQRAGGGWSWRIGGVSRQPGVKARGPAMGGGIADRCLPLESWMSCPAAARTRREKNVTTQSCGRRPGKNTGRYTGCQLINSVYGVSHAKGNIERKINYENSLEELAIHRDVYDRAAINRHDPCHRSGIAKRRSNNRSFN